MARATHENGALPEDIVPLVDDGAECSAIDMIELKLLFNDDSSSGLAFDPIPDSLNGVTHWHFGTGQHASAFRKILGWTALTAESDNDQNINNRHILIEGSSQWVIGRNVTSKINILHVGRNAVQLLKDTSQDYISMKSRERLSYIPLSRFIVDQQSSVLSCLSSGTATNRSWGEIKHIVDKVHWHGCGHASYTDIRILLDRNSM